MGLEHDIQSFPVKNTHFRSMDSSSMGIVPDIQKI